MDAVLNTLSFIADKLNAGNLVWAVGGSMLLKQYGLVEKPNDIDIMTDLNSFAQAAAILKSIGEEKPPAETQLFATRHIYKCRINGFDVDLMSGLAIKHQNGLFHYIFDGASVSGTMKAGGVEIPLTSLEDWYVIYQLIPGRQAKADLISDYLMSNGVRRADLFSRMLRADLPPEVKENIAKMLALQ
jgi:hypothetical protein